MVFTGSSSSCTMAIPTSTAIRLPGIRRLIFGQRIRMARQTAPTSTAQTLTVPRFRKKQAAFSIVSMGLSAYVTPKKSFHWPMKMVTAIPAVKPVVMV